MAVFPEGSDKLVKKNMDWMMKEQLIDILMNTSIPVKCRDNEIGTCHISRDVAEKFADELVNNGVMLQTFKVGDIVWVHDFMWGIIPCEIDRPYHCRCGEEGSCTFEVSFDEPDIGKYVFATKEDAEEVWRK